MIPAAITTESVACNLCGSHEKSTLAEFVMYARSALVKCRVCGLVYVSPRLTRESMALHFNSNYLQGAEAVQWEQSRRPIYQQILDLVRKHGKNQAFEIGCSYGTFLAMCQDTGFDVGGCDISAGACRRASALLGVEILNGDLEQVGNLVAPQECIVSIDTIYYCADPYRHLTLIHELLKPRGIVVLRVRHAWDLQLRRSLHLEAVPIEHIYVFTPATLGNLLQKAGFVLQEVGPGVCKGFPRAVDMSIRGASRLAMAVLGHRYCFSRDFCVVAMKR
jgi:SAM-dependent methyltransferase